MRETETLGEPDATIELAIPFRMRRDELVLEPTTVELGDELAHDYAMDTVLHRMTQEPPAEYRDEEWVLMLRSAVALQQATGCTMAQALDTAVIWLRG